jgi:transposase
MPAQYVKPYVQTNQSDYLDAEAIAEAVQRPRMRFVPIKTGSSSICKGCIACASVE